jgi:hypothetical protein
MRRLSDRPLPDVAELAVEPELERRRLDTLRDPVGQIPDEKPVRPAINPIGAYSLVAAAHAGDAL